MGPTVGPSKADDWALLSLQLLFELHDQLRIVRHCLLGRQELQVLFQLLLLVRF